MDEQLNLLEKYYLTPTELFTIQTILLSKDGDSEYIFRFAGILTKCGSSLRDVLISLQNKGIIIKSYKIPNKGEAFYSIKILLKLFIKVRLFLVKNYLMLILLQQLLKEKYLN